MDKYAVGITGESEAKDYLESIGYKIVDTNVNFPGVGELDIVATDGNVLVFVEVRTRSDNFFGNPLESLTQGKIKKIIAASKRYLAAHKSFYGGYRYDVIGILRGNVTHIKNAFYAYWR
ncbi:MAG: YraN family protein [Christensenellales bacterium]